MVQTTGNIQASEKSEAAGRPSAPDWPAAWELARARMRRELGNAIFEAWISPLSLESFADGDLKIGATKPFMRNWVANHYATRIEKAFLAEGFRPAALSIVMAAQASAAAAPPPPSASVSYLHPRGEAHTYAAAEPGREKSLWNRMLHPQQTFDSFIPGPVNEFGHGAARAFANGEQADIPLLYIHGGFGYGKTHLLNAAALESRKRGKRTLFLRAEDFMRHFLGALYRKDTLTFKEEMRSAEVLIIDDLQHICRSASTAAELLYTVNAFADLRRRVVIAADRLPQALEGGLGADVKSRMAGGLVVGLDKPDRDTRLAILKSRAAAFSRHKPDVVLPDTVLERIADLEDASPREMIAIFITLAVAEEAVGLRGGPGAKTSIEDIQRKTAEFYKLEVKDFHSPQRARRVARPRQVAMYLSRKLTTRSLPEIGRRFGGRDHTTVLHACRRIEALIGEDSLFRQEVDFLSQMLQRKADL